MSLLRSAARGNLVCNAKRIFLRNRCRNSFPDAPQTPYFSQAGQDQFLDRFVFRGMRGGVFVDIGAHDGMTMSNSLYFERELGWVGLCVEPNPRQYARLVGNRTAQCVNCAVAERAGLMKFLQLPEHLDLGAGLIDYFDKESSFSSAQPAGSAILDVPVATLANLISRAGLSRIDYLSIDTEGADFGIIRSIEFEALDISVVSVENSRWDERIAVRMAEQGYELVAVLGNDEIYRDRSSCLPSGDRTSSRVSLVDGR